MCEVCNLREETEKLAGELQFRFTQFQVELNSDRPEEAERCQRRAQACFDQIFQNFRKKYSMEAQLDVMDDLVKH